ncbi:MAG TPA: chemotaxis response regulator protein-glutamate methylesterase [Blastocatellia bacterium]|nr:chemotaxis response regulator protein-glutamate methylesterase [Blastocatellia bacterium]
MSERKGPEGEHMEAEKNKVRVLVVDDSAVMRKLIPQLLERDREIEVVATAIDGDFAIRKIEDFKPDVVTLDVDMPRMDGLTTLDHIVSKHRTPVVMLSSLTTRGAAMTMKALELGAVDFICKPKGLSQVGQMGEELISKVKAAARSKVIRLNSPPPRPGSKKKSSRLPRRRGSEKIVVIGASSGGPNALRYLLPKIPADFDAGIVVVQHLPESFTGLLAQWLDELCELDVCEASEGDRAYPGRVLIANGRTHTKVRRKERGAEIVLERGEPVNGHMPSVDVLFESVAKEYADCATALIMTGMGRDGANGIGQIKSSGGYTVAQDKSSCAIFGMPRVAIEKGFIDKVLPLEDLASHLVSVIGRSE